MVLCLGVCDFGRCAFGRTLGTMKEASLSEAGSPGVTASCFTVGGAGGETFSRIRKGPDMVGVGEERMKPMRRTGEKKTQEEREGKNEVES